MNAYRDWSHAKDMVRGMWQIMQQEEPNDYLLASGVTKSVKDLVEYVFGKLDYTKYVKTDKKFERPEELHYLKGDSSKARTELNWKPEYTFETMLDEMIEYWINKLSNDGD